MISIFIPVRKGSKRVKNKMYQKFFGKSLIEIKIEQLFKSNVDEIIVGSDDIKINVSYFNEKSNMTKPGEISKITIFNNVNIEEEEPICIDIARKILYQNKFYQAYDNGKYFVSEKLFFDGQDFVDIFNIEVPIPLSVDKYLSSIYGKNWETPDPAWQSSNYSNLKT